jgi:hypothetical protein
MYIFVFLNMLFLFVGFVLYRCILSNTEIYHGPNASEIMKYVYHDQNTKKYFKFDIKMYVCPTSKNAILIEN